LAKTKALLAVVPTLPSASVALNAALYVAATAVGVPLTAPVLELTLTPVGNAPDATAYAKGALPLVAVIDWLNATLRVIFSDPA